VGVAALAAAVSLAAVARASEPLTLASATERALAQSPDVRSAEAEVRAAQARLDGASVLLATNPELSAKIGPRDNAGVRTVDYEAALSQRVEVGGQRGSRMAAARAAVGAAEARLAATRTRIAAEVREALGRATASAVRAEMARDSLLFSEQAAEAAERRFRAGDVARIEVNSARVERGRAARIALEAEQERLAAEAELGTLLGFEPGSPPPGLPGLEELGRWTEEPVDSLLQEALTSRRDLAALRLDLAAAEEESTLAERSAIPSPALGISVAREEKANLVLGTLTIDLPFFVRNQGERGATAARVQQARIAVSALERRVAQEVRLAAERARSSRRLLDALEPGAARALAEDLALATKAYEAGEIEFLRYQQVRRDAVDASRDRIDTLEALNRAAAQLDRAVGRPLFPVPAHRDGG
jgi:cobalt-zinc-cadmium efflux system outer membrane protein